MNRTPPTAAELSARDRRLDVLKVMASHMGHQFKNLLVPQLGYATLIREEAGPESPVTPFATKLQDASRKADLYLESILNAVRPQRRFRPRVLDLAGLVQKALSVWESRLPEGAGIQISTELTSFSRMFDDTHWENALLHLLTNCQEAMPTGGDVRITLENETRHSPEQLGLQGSVMFHLRIQDTGRGMTPEVIDRCFEPFFSTRGKIRNYGIGLTLAHSVVLLHGGQIAIESEPGQGTIVNIWLPPN